MWKIVGPPGDLPFDRHRPTHTLSELGDCELAASIHPLAARALLLALGKGEIAVLAYLQ